LKCSLLIRKGYRFFKLSIGSASGFLSFTREASGNYVRSMVVEILVNDEEDSALVDDGRIVGGWETIGEDGFAKNV